MNKLLTTLASLMIAVVSFASTANSIEFKVGVAANTMVGYGNAKEELKDSGAVSNDEVIAAFNFASVFAEVQFEEVYGLAVGFEYTPDTISFEKETRVIPAAKHDDSGSQIIDASVEDVMTAYVSVPVFDTAAYVKLGYTMATLNTKETLATGSTYSDLDLEAMTVGIGFDTNIGEMAFFRTEVMLSEYDDLSVTGTQEGVASSGSYNKITAELGTVTGKAAIGIRF